MHGGASGAAVGVLAGKFLTSAKVKSAVAVKLRQWKNQGVLNQLEPSVARALAAQGLIQIDRAGNITVNEQENR